MLRTVDKDCNDDADDIVGQFHIHSDPQLAHGTNEVSIVVPRPGSYVSESSDLDRYCTAGVDPHRLI
jgi:hypothetical protein